MKKQTSIDLLPNDLQNGFTIYLVVYGNDDIEVFGEGDEDAVIERADDELRYGDGADVLRVDVNPNNVERLRLLYTADGRSELVRHA